jgi:AcrR family transcriptional regulator
VTKQALLEAAMQVFAARGFDAATTREVAAKAGANEQLIQRYFGGKAGLLLAILERFGSEEQRCAGTLPPPQDSVEAEIAGFLGFHLGHGLACRDFHEGRALPGDRRSCRRRRRDPAAPSPPPASPPARAKPEALRGKGAIDPGGRTLDAVATAPSSLQLPAWASSTHSGVWHGS